jgi:hypothetical protein
MSPTDASVDEQANASDDASRPSSQSRDSDSSGEAGMA